MEIDKIKALITLLEDTNITDFELNEGEESVKISKPNPNANIVAASAPIIAAAPTPVANTTPSSLANEEGVVEPILGKTINSPMVGTFYAAPSPDVDLLAKVGQEVKTGDAVCIVEAMKMFNKIEADQEGKIKRILVNDGDPVEFDQPIFEIE